jgi:hypothetical protein
MQTRLRRLRPLAACTLLLAGAPAFAQTPATAPKAPASAPSTPKAADAELPTFEEIHQRSLEAMGGKEAMDKIEFTTVTGFMEMPAMGMKGAMKTQVATPDRQRTTMTLPGLGDIMQGMNGDVGWSIDPMRGPALTEPKEMAQQKTLEELSNGRHDPREIFPTIEVRSLGDFAGRPCFEVFLKNDDLEMTSFYDAKTFLVAGMRMTMESPLGQIPAEVVIGDYKKQGDLMLPGRSTTRVMGQEQVVVFESYSFDPIDDSVFDLPEAIKGLLAAREAQKNAEGNDEDGAGDGDAATDDAPPARRPRPRPRPKTDAPSTAPTP